MSSHRELVILAVEALITAALPLAKVKRNAVKQDTIGPNGYVIIRDGDPGTPEVTLNPTTYLYEHPIEVAVAANASGLTTAESVLDGMLGAIGVAVASNRTLGGLCDYLMVTAPSVDSIDGVGSTPARLADFNVIAVYGVADPLS